MFSFIKKNLIQNISATLKTKNSAIYNSLSKVPSKSFVSGRWNLKKFKKETSTNYLKDFTKSSTAKEWMNKKINIEKSKLKEEKLSTLVATEDKTKLGSLNPYFKPNKRQFNTFLRKKAIERINLNEQKDAEDLSMKLFSIDHTAQVLENIRKLRENRIFNRKVHEVKEKKLALKLESRKLENVIEDFNQKFKNFENYNGTNTSNSLNSKNYNLMEFFSDSTRSIGAKLDEPNALNFSNLNGIKEKLHITDNSHAEYVKNKHELANIRISNLLTTTKNNPKLQKYLIEQNSSPTLFNKISAESTTEKDSEILNDKPYEIINIAKENDSSLPEPDLYKTTNQNSSSSIISNLYKSPSDIMKEDPSLADSLSNFFQPHINLTTKIQQYEVDVYNDYKNTDLYKKYNNGIAKFGDLTLHENLNYIKFNVVNSKEIFRLFNEIKHQDFIENPITKITNLNNRPVIFSGLLQKLATGYKEEEDRERIFSLIEYKDLLKAIKENIPNIKNRTVVDNFWSIAKLHKTNRIFSPKFFQHLLKDIFTELNKEDRMSNLTFQECSFLCEGLNFININENYDDQLVAKKELELVENLYNRLLEISQKESIYLEMHPYNYGKILNYFYYINLDYPKYAQLLANFGKPLKKYIEYNGVFMMDVIKNKDIVNIVRAYSWAIAKYKILSNSVKSEKENEIMVRVEYSGEDKGKVNSENIENSSNSDNSSTELTIANNKELMVKEKEIKAVDFFKEIVFSMTNVTVAKRRLMEISHCTKLIYHFANAEVYDKLTFQYLQLQLKDKLTRVEDFKIDDILNYTYGISKYITKDVYPDFYHDTNSIIYPNLSEKVSSLKFSVLNLFKDKLFDKKEMFNAESLSIICYSAAIMGYSDIDFYLPIYHNIISADSEKYSYNNQMPKLKLENVGYLMQSLSLLNFNDEYVLNSLTQKFLSLISKNLNSDFESEKSSENNIQEEEESGNYLTPINDFSLSQILSSLVNLSSRKYFRTVRNWKNKIDRIKKYADVNYSHEHGNYIVSVLWFMTYFENFDEKFYDKMFEKINHNKLRKFEKIVLNQIILKNYIANNYVYQEFTKEILEDLNKASINFERERKSIAKKISIMKYQEKSFEEKVSEILKQKESVLKKEGLDHHRNFTIANSYMIPFYFPKTKICVLFYDHSELMKDKNINGYNSIKEDIILDLGYKIERVYSTEYDKLIDSDEKIFELIYNKIKF